MTTSHTPAPWTASGSEENTAVWVSDSFGKRVCTVKNCPEDWANARLIAAAPELLEALEAALEVIQSAKKYMPKSIKNSDLFGLLNHEANTIRPAIAKAKGEA